MSSFIGNNLKISIFGQSHSQAIGVSIDGLESGFEIDESALAAFMQRRAPGGELSTKRKEADSVEILSGLFEKKTCGAPLCAIIKNTNTKSADYKNIADMPRPGHADITAEIKYGGFQDKTGGGHFSGRLTAPLCIAGGIAMQILNQKGIFIGAHIKSIADIEDDGFDAVNISKEDIENLHQKSFAVIEDAQGEKMKAAVKAAAEEGDSLGGVIECAAVGIPAGVGDPMFDGMENNIAKTVFGIPAVKGVEFGAGFAAAKLKGSENNDEMYYDDGVIKTKTNNAGGILGGITNGMPLIMRAAFKPTPSIFKEQNTVSLSQKQNAVLKIQGRHDPCILMRAVPVIEAAVAIAVLDAIMQKQ